MGTVSVLQEEERSRDGCGDSCTAVLMYLTSLNLTLRIGYDGKFYVMGILPQLRIIIK